MNYIIKWEDSGVYVEFSSKATGKDVILINDIFYSSDSFDRMKFQFWDFSKVKDFTFTKEEIEIISMLDSASAVWNKSMVIIIVGNNMEFISMVEDYKNNIIKVGWVCEWFSEMEPAKAYLEKILAKCRI